MALVDYSDSDSDSESSSPGPPSKKPKLSSSQTQSQSALPPLPSSFHDLYASTVRISTKDDPSLHGGRQRVTPHVEGNWPTHVYLEWNPTPIELGYLDPIVKQLDESHPSASITSLLMSDLNAPLPLHISLSRSLSLQTEQRHSFRLNIEEAVNNCGIRPFQITFTSIQWVPNYEQTRWFLVLGVEKPSNDGLNLLLGTLNQVCTSMELPLLYASPAGKGKQGTLAQQGPKKATIEPPGPIKSNPPAFPQPHSSIPFHISMGWILSPPTPEMYAKTAELDLSSLKKMTIKFTDLKVKMGNAVHPITFPGVSVRENKGFVGY
ncbi:MAG: poly(U)-specific 3'-to-5' RNA exonuclease [Cirrosporium novae-zelandiae]|nr:MAG: poly(U)-specific 3'-to-5' RNA exonuclease [Cirrosporium novae-zelandiae]KAI9735639.1 MAG: poly(U)-specific 3'-to-5' RNA exonuclease [Cirrosporium novae-zelandiae]